MKTKQMFQKHKKRQNSQKSSKNTILLEISGKRLQLDIKQIQRSIQKLYKKKICEHFAVLPSPLANQKPNKKVDKRIAVTNDEACSSIWRIFQQELQFKIEQRYEVFSEQFFKEGKTVLRSVSPDQIKMKSADHDEQPKDHKQSLDQGKSKYEKKYEEQILKDLRSTMEQMRVIMETEIKNQYELQQKGNENLCEVLEEYLKDAILSKEKQIFQRSILGIKQTNNQSITLIFEESYPQLSMEKSEAQKILGEQAVFQKMASYQTYFQTYYLQNDTENMLNCHYCLSSLSSCHMSCSGTRASPTILSLLFTDPFVFFDKILCQKAFQAEIQESRKFHYPYLLYYRAKHSQKYVCGRIFCKRCEVELNLEENCKFCQGDCNCQRCSAVDFLVKMMGVFLKYGGNLFDLKDKFLLKFEPGSQCQIVLKKQKRQKEEKSKSKVIEYLKKTNIFLSKHKINKVPVKFMIEYLDGEKFIEKPNDFFSRKRVYIPSKEEAERNEKLEKKERMRRKKLKKKEAKQIEGTIPKDDIDQKMVIDSDEDYNEVQKGKIFEELQESDQI